MSCLPYGNHNMSAFQHCFGNYLKRFLKQPCDILGKGMCFRLISCHWFSYLAPKRWKQNLSFHFYDNMQYWKYLRVYIVISSEIRQSLTLVCPSFIYILSWVMNGGVRICLSLTKVLKFHWSCDCNLRVSWEHTIMFWYSIMTVNSADKPYIKSKNTHAHITYTNKTVCCLVRM